MLAALSTLLVACHAAYPQSNGYVLSSRNPFAAAAPQVALDDADPPISKLKAGFTLAIWLRSNGLLSAGNCAAPFHLAHALDTLMIEVFCGLNGGFLFQTNAPTTTQVHVHTWTHVAFTHNTTSTDLNFYVNGVQQPMKSLVGSIPLDTQVVQMHLFAGSCTGQDYASVGTPSAPFTCSSASYPGEMDDFAVFNRALKADEMAGTPH